MVVISLAHLISESIDENLGSDLGSISALVHIMRDIIRWFAVPQFVKCNLGVICPVGGCCWGCNLGVAMLSGR